MKEIIQSQYLASLEMLKQAVLACPDEIWDNQEDRNRFWHVTYHSLFYVHLYLQDREQDFVPWERHHEQNRSLGQKPVSAQVTPGEREPYTRQEVLAYYDLVVRQVQERVPALDLEAESGFYWLPFSKLELQFYNIRHIQQHTGELYERLGTRAGIDLKWVGACPPENIKKKELE